MREALFLQQNTDKWKRYEQEVHLLQDSDVFSDRFIELTDDLAYARTFYPNSDTTRHLNGLAGRFHQNIYINKTEKTSRILSFWQFELPYLFKQYHRQLLYAFLFFAAFCFLGALSAKHDDTFVRLVLGDGYVDMTNENIERGDPFGVYKDGSSISMFLRIASNNIMVAFYAYVLGIFCSVGTIWLLLKNGLMLGCFEYYFFQQGIGWKSILVVFIHGTLEISAIVIAGCAGLIVGSSLMFPKTYSRWISLQKGAKDAMKIVFGLVPVFIVAALLESFVTRHTDMPLALSISILAFSLLFIIWYFIIYPIRLHKRVHSPKDIDFSTNSKQFEIWMRKKLSSEK